MPGYSPRGGDVDRNGVFWTALASGHLASFDRRKCKAPLNGPKATGDHCPEGWTFHQYPQSPWEDRKSTRLNSSHLVISYAVFCLKKKKKRTHEYRSRMIQSTYANP